MEIKFAFEIGFAISASIPCFLLIIIYLFYCSKLTLACYMKLEFTMSLLIIIILRLIRFGKKKDTIELRSFEKTIAFGRNFFELVLSFLLTFTTFLSLLTAKFSDFYLKHKKILFIIFSFLSWILSFFYVLGFYLISKDSKDYSCLNKEICLLNLKIKFIIDCVLSAVMIIGNLIIFIIIIIELISRHRNDEDVPCGKAFFMLLSSLLLLLAELINLIGIRDIDTTINEYGNIFFLFTISAVSIIYCIDRVVREGLSRFFGNLTGLEQDPSEDSEDDHSDEEEGEEQVFVSNNEEKKDHMYLFSNSERQTSS